MSRRHLLFAALCLAPTLALAQMATAPFDGRLKKIHETKTISVAYRTDALPFSFEDSDKKPAGYTVDLCRSIIGVIERQIGVSPLQVKWVPVTTQNRFSAISSGQADMECGASTVTLGRMREVSFSTLTFLDGTGLLVRGSTPGTTLLDLSGKKIGVISGTSNERAVADALKAKVVTATIVPVKSRDEGLAQLEAGTIDAFASDRVLLVGLASKAKDPKSLALLVDALSYEPYAIALPRGDWAMKQAVDAALAQIYRSSAIGEIYGRWFGAHGAAGAGAGDHVRHGSPARIANRSRRRRRFAATGIERRASAARERLGDARNRQRGIGRVEPAQHHHRVEPGIDPDVVAAGADHEDRVASTRPGKARPSRFSQSSRP